MNLCTVCGQPAARMLAIPATSAAWPGRIACRQCRIAARRYTRVQADQAKAKSVNPYADRQKRYAHDRARGIAYTVPAQPVAAHVRSLVRYGWRPPAIAAEAGVSASMIRALLYGETRTTRRRQADAIMGVRAQRPTRSMLSNGQPASPLVPAEPTRRRIRALQRLGWRHEDIREACGVQTATLLNRPGPYVRRSTQDKVAAAYRRLSVQRGPSGLNRARLDRASGEAR